MQPAVGRAVRTLDEGRLAAPDCAGAILATEEVLLVVGGAEYIVSQEAEQQDCQGVSVRELDGVINQVQALQGTSSYY